MTIMVIIRFSGESRTRSLPSLLLGIPGIPLILYPPQPNENELAQWLVPVIPAINTWKAEEGGLFEFKISLGNISLTHTHKKNERKKKRKEN